MAKERVHDLQETKGSFQISGIVTGVDKDKFYEEKETTTKKPMRMINFGVEFDVDKTAYISLNGIPKAEVVFSKTEGKDKNKKTIIKKVKWEDRHKFNEEGYRLVGVNLGLTKVIGTDGREVNDKKLLTEYDACKYISEHLQDEQSVFVKGKIEYSTFNDRHMTKFVPTQISLCRPIDFEDEKFTPTASFQQTIVFMGIQPNEDETKFIVSAKISTYNSVEDAEFVITNANLANVFRKNLKPYTAINVWGNINVEKSVEEVYEDDGWGESNPMDKIKSPFTRELVITGADKTSIDTDTYTEEIVSEAIAKVNAKKNAQNDFADNNEEWGSGLDTANITDEDNDW